MKYRITMWAILGFLIAAGWALYAFSTAPPALTAADPLLPLVEFTCPVALAGRYFPISLYSSLLANAAAYALIGLTVETLGRRMARAN